jgi:hypothetical protein
VIIGVHGTNSFDDYSVFMRAMGVAMSDMKNDDKEFFVYTFGPTKVNNFAAEFCNLSERGMKARGKKIRFYKVPISWGEENMQYFNYFAFFSKPNEPVSKLVSKAELDGIEVGIFRY